MPRVSSTRSRTARPPTIVANGRPTRAARPRTFASDDDDYLTPSPSPTAARSPTPGFFSRSTSPAWAQVGLGRRQFDISLPKKVPNMFMMYKNDFHRRYPEVCVLERLPTQRMRIAARLWDLESLSIREHYERRYRDAMIAAGRRFAEKDMKKRKKRSLNVTSTRRAKRAAQGETLTRKSQAIIEHWSYGLRRSKLVKAIHDWEEVNNINVASNARQQQLQQMLMTLEEIECEAALQLDEQAAPSPSQSELKAEESYSPSPTEGQFRPRPVELEDSAASPAFEVASPSPPAALFRPSLKSETCATPPHQSEPASQEASAYAVNGGTSWARYALNGGNSSPVQAAANQDGNCRGAEVDAIGGLCQSLGYLEIRPNLHATTPILREMPPVVEDCVMEDVPTASADDSNYPTRLKLSSVTTTPCDLPQSSVAQVESILDGMNPFSRPDASSTQQPLYMQADGHSPSPSDILFFENMIFDEDVGSLVSHVEMQAQPTPEHVLKHDEQEVPVMLYSGDDDQWRRQRQDVLWDWNYASLVEPALLEL